MVLFGQCLSMYRLDFSDDSVQVREVFGSARASCAPDAHLMRTCAPHAQILRTYLKVSTFLANMLIFVIAGIIITYRIDKNAARVRNTRGVRE